MLTDAEFTVLAREVKARSGAVLSRDLSGAIVMRLQPLARREGYAGVGELIAAARARADNAIWNALAEQLAHTETRFFRDRNNFKRLREDHIPEALRRRGHERVRIWSAGCATGQEPYSIAMIVEDMRDQGVNPAVEIIATDFAERLIEKARSGLYTQFEVQRGVPIRTLISRFERANDLWRISDRLRAAVRFETFNFLKHPGQLGQFDIIMLAHVLGSFDAETGRAVLNRVAEALHPEGMILIGEGESPPADCEGLRFEGAVGRRQRAARAAA